MHVGLLLIDGHLIDRLTEKISYNHKAKTKTILPKHIYNATLLKNLMSRAGMKKNIVTLMLVAVFASCGKEKKYPVVTGTVQQAGGCLPNTWLVLITSGDADKYSFLCQSSNPTSSLNCSNSVYIFNMPASLSQLGKRIKFSRWKDDNVFCLSSSFAPHHLRVSDLTAE